MPELDRGLLLYPYEWFNRALDTGSEEDRDAFVACFHPDAAVREAFGDVPLQVERMFIRGDAGVLVLAHVRGTPGGSSGGLRVVHALRVEDGRVRDFGVFERLAPALASAGVQEHDEIPLAAPLVPGDRVQAYRNAMSVFNVRGWDEAAEWLSPDLELVENALGVDSTTYRGREGFRRWVETSVAAAEAVSFDPIHVIAGREALCALTRVRSRTAGIDFEFQVAQAFRWRRGLNDLLASFASLDAAAAQTGLEPELGVLRLYDIFNDGRYGDFRDALHPDVVWEETVLPEGGTYRGHGGIDDWFAVASGAFSEVAFGVETIAPAGSGLLVTHELRSRGTSSGVATQQRVHHAVRLDDGRVAYVGAFSDEGRARARLSP